VILGQRRNRLLALKPRWSNAFVSAKQFDLQVARATAVSAQLAGQADSPPCTTPHQQTDDSDLDEDPTHIFETAGEDRDAEETSGVECLTLDTEQLMISEVMLSIDDDMGSPEDGDIGLDEDATQADTDGHSENAHASLLWRLPVCFVFSENSFHI
jgi:hypothetical protein